MKKLLLISAMFIVLLGSPIYALTVDLQPYTQCGLTSCTITVDMAKVKAIDDKALSSGELTSLKSVALETKAVALPKEVKDLKASWNGDILKFTANIKAGSSNYFTINYNGIVLDPWFNSTVWSNWTNPDTTGGGNSDPLNGWFGYTILTTNIANGNYDIYIKKNSGASGTVCSLWLYTNITTGGDFILNRSFTGDNCNFTGISLLNNTKYNIFVNANPSRTFGAQHYPYYSTFFNVTGRGYLYGGVWTYGTDNTFVIEQINISYNVNTFYNMNLFINSAMSNATHTYTPNTNDNLTAAANLTGLPVSLMIDGTVYTNGITNASYLTALGGGLHTIIGNWSGNATHEKANATLWLTINNATPVLTINYNITGNNTTINTPVLVNCTGNTTVKLYNDTAETTNPTIYQSSISGNKSFVCNTTGNTNFTIASLTGYLLLINNATTGGAVIGYVQCTDNSTLGHINVTNLQTDNVITYYENCASGCDNITSSCSPPQYVSNIGTFVIILIVIAGITIMLKRR